jgi:hypothetical protein
MLRKRQQLVCDRRGVDRQRIEVKLSDLFHFERPARTILHSPDNEQRSFSVPIVRAVRKPVNKLHAGVRGEANLLAKFADHCSPAVFAPFLTAAWKSPALGIAKRHKHHFACRCQRYAMNTRGSRA